MAEQRFKVSEEAALWLVRLQEDDSADCRTQFAAWARQSPLHVQEFLFARATTQYLSGFDPQRRIDLATLEDAGELDNVIALADSRQVTVESPQPLRAHRPTRLAWKAALVASVVLAVVLGLWTTLSGDDQTYSAAVGDQQTIKLADGSVMYLNTDSQAQVNFTAELRHVRLLAGEALFVVAPDARRAFLVTTADASIRALGTQFNVYRQGGATRVSVVEGAVRVETQLGTHIAPVELAAGDQAEVVKGQIVKSGSADVERAVAWRARRLIFQADPLEEVVREFNRYDSRHPIRVEGEAIRRRAISGVFDADNPVPLLEFLEADDELSVIRSTDAIVIRSRARTGDGD